MKVPRLTEILRSAMYLSTKLTNNYSYSSEFLFRINFIEFLFVLISNSAIICGNLTDGISPFSAQSITFILIVHIHHSYINFALRFPNPLIISLMKSISCYICAIFIFVFITLSFCPLLSFFLLSKVYSTFN